MKQKELGNEWFDDFESYKTWEESLIRQSRKGSVSAQMMSNYRSGLRQLVKFVRLGWNTDATPDTIMDWAKSEDPKTVMDLMYNFENWLQGKEVEGYPKRQLAAKRKYPSPLSAAQKAHGMIRGFFTHNDLLLPKSGKKTTGRGVTKKNDRNFAVFTTDPDTNLVVKDYSLIKQFLSHMIYRDQTIALCLISTGQDSGDVLGLNIGFVKSQATKNRLYWEGERDKTSEEFRTFFSQEATEYVRRYIAQERNGAGDDEPIFIRGKWTKADDEESTKSKPMTARNLGLNYFTAAQKMGIINGDTQNPLRPKRMRSIFSSACYQAKIDDGLRHVLMGHKGSISESYREMPAANLEQKYALVEPFVTVFTEDHDQELRITKKKSSEALDLALDLRADNKKLQHEVSKLKNMVGVLAERLGMDEAYFEAMGIDADVISGVIRKYNPEES